MRQGDKEKLSQDHDYKEKKQPVDSLEPTFSSALFSSSVSHNIRTSTQSIQIIEAIIKAHHFLQLVIKVYNFKKITQTEKNSILLKRIYSKELRPYWIALMQGEKEYSAFTAANKISAADYFNKDQPLERPFDRIAGYCCSRAIALLDGYLILIQQLNQTQNPTLIIAKLKLAIAKKDLFEQSLLGDASCQTLKKFLEQIEQLVGSEKVERSAKLAELKDKMIDFLAKDLAKVAELRNTLTEIGIYYGDFGCLVQKYLLMSELIYNQSRNSNPVDEKEIRNVLNDALTAAEIYLSPGYFLLAKVFNHLGYYYDQRRKAVEELATKNNLLDNSLYYYSQAYKAVKISLGFLDTTSLDCYYNCRMGLDAFNNDNICCWEDKEKIKSVLKKLLNDLKEQIIKSLWIVCKNSHQCPNHYLKTLEKQIQIELALIKEKRFNPSAIDDIKLTS